MRTGDNIRLRKDGRYEARYPRGRDQRGRIIYGYCYGRTWEEAVQKREEALRIGLRLRALNLLILGAGSHGQEVRELAQRLNVFRRIAFLDDDITKTGVLGPCSGVEQYLDEYPAAIPAVGNSPLRMQWLKKLTYARFALPVLIHPDAVVSPSAEVGCGTVVCARAVVGAGASVGCGCIISSGVTIDRDVQIPDGTHIDCGRVVTGTMEIERRQRA